jgi:hypothetical protein
MNKQQFESFVHCLNSCFIQLSTHYQHCLDSAKEASDQSKGKTMSRDLILILETFIRSVLDAPRCRRRRGGCRNRRHRSGCRNHTRIEYNGLNRATAPSPRAPVALTTMSGPDPPLPPPPQDPVRPMVLERPPSTSPDRPYYWMGSVPYLGHADADLSL